MSAIGSKRVRGMDSRVPSVDRAYVMLDALIDGTRADLTPEQITNLSRKLLLNAPDEFRFTGPQAAEIAAAIVARTERERHRRNEPSTHCGRNHPYSGPGSDSVLRLRNGRVYFDCLICRRYVAAKKSGARERAGNAQQSKQRLSSRDERCACVHPRRVHIEGECYHRGEDREFDCDCTFYTPADIREE